MHSAVEVARIFSILNIYLKKKKSILPHLVKEKSTQCVLKELIILAL